jgi:Flp pilus assembly protein TadD
MDPNAAAAANNLAWLLAETGENLDLAMHLAENARRQFPDSAEIIDTIGWIHYKRGTSSVAVVHFEQCIEKQPKNALFHFHLGMAHAHRGDDAKARVALERALSLSQSFSGAEEAKKTLAKLVY